VTDKAHERRLKKTILGTPHAAVVHVPRGFVDVAAAELEALLATRLFPDKEPPTQTRAAHGLEIGGIAFRELAALGLRATTAREILWTLAGKRDVTSKAKLAKAFEAAPLDLVLPEGAAVGLRVVSTASRLYHETMIKELLGEALATRGFAVTRDEPAFLVDARLQNDRLTVALSLDAVPLHRRGYKVALKGTASIKEDLAAACLRVALGGTALPSVRRIFVPFAGSGTLGFEALLAAGVPGALFKAPTSLERSPAMPAATASFTRRKLVERWRDAAPAYPPIRFVESDAAQVEALRTNTAHFNAALTAAGASPVAFEIEHGDAFAAPWPDDALILLNPPYGDRLGEGTSGKALYRAIGERLGRLANVRGLALAPTEGIAADLASTPSYATATRKISHGGRPTWLVTFQSL
jgi:23S rRNA G2445 N2-methylase RlmL